eukprot:2412777-Pyramimonas_sp.AAC.1
MGELRVQDGARQHETTIFNIHNNDLSGSDRQRLRAARQAAAQRSALHPDSHDYCMVGGFNIAQTPPKNLLHPTADSTAERYHYQPVFWKNIISQMVEITAKATTHRCAANRTEATIDRCFVSISAPNIPHIETLLVADGRPLDREGGPISDRKLLHLRPRPRQPRPVNERGIPAFHFESKHCKLYFKRLVEMADLSADPISNWRTMKHIGW